MRVLDVITRSSEAPEMILSKPSAGQMRARRMNDLSPLAFARVSFINSAQTRRPLSNDSRQGVARRHERVRSTASLTEPKPRVEAC